MKKELKHRVDRLMEKAIAGDADAQLNLAKEFNKGCIVEKSLDHARYWAFKAISGGNTSAIYFYTSISSDYQATTSERMDSILNNLKWLPWIEFVGAILLFIILPNEITPNSILGWFLGVGLASLFLMSFVGKTLNRFFKLALDKGTAITIIIIHIIGIIIACS